MDGNGDEWVRVLRIMRGLRSYGLSMHDAYTRDEKRLLMPQRKWWLYTFASQTQRAHFRTVSTAQWELYELAKQSGPARRPRPYIDS